MTGGSRGIGWAVVERLVRDGVSVVFSFATDLAAAHEVLATVRAGRSEEETIEAVQADFADHQAAQRLYDAADAQLGGLDILVKKAGSNVVPSRSPRPAMPTMTS